MKSLLDSILPLAEQLQAIKTECRARGIFTNDRELLTCPKCGLMEDVESGGRLITSFSNSLGSDTGLRFKELKCDKYRCPKCSAVVAEPILLKL